MPCRVVALADPKYLRLLRLFRVSFVPLHARAGTQYLCTSLQMKMILPAMARLSLPASSPPCLLGSQEVCRQCKKLPRSFEEDGAWQFPSRCIGF